VVALVAGIAAFPLVRDSAQSRAGTDLARLAELTATTVTQDPQGQFVVPPRVGVVLQTEGVSAYVVFRGVDEPPPGTTQRDIDLVTTGRSVSGTGSTEDGDVLVEGRPLDRGPLGRGTGVLLVQPVSVAIGPALAVLWRVAAALALGIVVAIVVAVIVSQRMARSLRAVATAADRLGRGERDVVVNAAGPSEVTQIAESINRLSQALTESEGRQRDFLLSVSHELRTPLTAVMGYAQAISDGLVESPDLSRTGAVMVTEAQRLDRLVSDLLDLARLQAVDFSFNLVEVDVRDIVVQAYDVWRDRCQRVGVDLQVTGIDSSVIDEDRSDEGFIVAVDPLRLRQIIDNLTENALRVTPEGGRIVFALTRLPDSLTLEVRDTGPGLTEEDIAVAFTPGALHGRYHGVRPVGTGVGLALVARLARGLGGTALAAQAPEGGARFTVVLPIPAGQAG
jgi:two-component system, OmpR family, sensor kinase